MCQEQKKQIYMWPSHWEKPAAHGDYGAVSCNNSYAARAGLWILKNGGNAFDAAAGVSLALSVVEPHHSGIGEAASAFSTAKRRAGFCPGRKRDSACAGRT